MTEISEMNRDYKKNMTWNMIGGILLTSTSLFFTIVISWHLKSEEIAIFLNAFNISQVMITVGLFELRTYQGTDVNFKYSFKEYRNFRYLTCLLMFVLTGLYILFNHFDSKEIMIIMLFMIYRMFEVLGDVYEGEWQRYGRFDLSGKTLTLKYIIIIIGFSVSLILFHNIILTLLVIIFLNILGFIIFDLKKFHKQYVPITVNFNINNLYSIFKDSFPLVAGMFMCAYILNYSKFLVKNTMTAYVFSIYHILFFALTFITMMANFIFRPMLVELSLMFSENNIKQMLKTIKKLFLIIFLFMIVTLICAWLFGIPVMDFVFQLQFAKYKGILMLVIIGGGIYTYNILMYFLLTIIRRQNWNILIYGLSLIVILLIPKKIILEYNLFGAAMLFILSQLIQLIFFIIIFYREIRKLNS